MYHWTETNFKQKKKEKEREESAAKNLSKDLIFESKKKLQRKEQSPALEREEQRPHTEWKQLSVSDSNEVDSLPPVEIDISTAEAGVSGELLHSGRGPAADSAEVGE